MVKKSHKYTKQVSLGVILIILLVIIGIIGVLYLSYRNFPVESSFSNHTKSPSVIMPAENYTYKDISVIGAKKLVYSNLNNPNFSIIDVSLNYNEGHIVGSVNYPIQDGSLDNAINMNSLSKDKIYLIYSRNEIDSLNAAKKLAINHFEVYRLKGNYGAWVDLGFGTENSYSG
jgi:rhodanese-related sulfurtransferase